MYILPPNIKIKRLLLLNPQLCRFLKQNRINFLITFAIPFLNNLLNILAHEK